MLLLVGVMLNPLLWTCRGGTNTNLKKKSTHYDLDIEKEIERWSV